MHVFICVGMTMMTTVMGCPPEWSTLCRTTGYKCTKELDYSVCLESPVRKIAMIEGGDGKHPD
jgi:hypothetical protein